MKNLKSILGFLLLIVIVASSCKRNKNDDGDANVTVKKYVPTEIIIRQSGTTDQRTWNFTYNSKRQITQMRIEGGTSIGTYDLFYLDNGNLDYYIDKFTGSPSTTISFKYDGGLRPIEMYTNGTPEVNISHSVSSNIYTVTIIGSGSYIDMDFDDNDNLQGFYGGTDSFVVSYLNNQQGVFANVALKPSVIIPFHIFPTHELYFMHPNQIDELSTPSSGKYVYTDQQRDANGNLSSFRMGSSVESLIYTITYELK